MTQDQSSQWQRSEKRTKNFQCPCGKSYLSYPALYTHIKQAHGGKAPGEIKRPDTHNRGRPKTTGNAKIQQHNKSIEQGLKIDPIPEFIKFLQGASSPQTRSIKEIYQYEPVYRLIMNDKDKTFTPQFLKQDRIYDVRMGEGIIQFFKEIKERIENKSMCDEVIMLIVLLTEHIIEETQDQNVLSLGTIGLMPQFVNYFMIHDFKKPVQRLKLENLWIFQDQNAIQVLNFFFKWMLFKRYTLTKVDVNQKYLNPDQSQSEQGEESQSEQNSNQNDNLQNDEQNEDQNEEENEKNEQNEEESQSDQDQHEKQKQNPQEQQKNHLFQQNSEKKPQ